MITYKVHFIRTGSTSDTEERRYVGQLDLPLCPSGRESIQSLAEKFRYPNAQVVYSSSLRRCLETADIIYPDTQVIPTSGLMDMNLGDFEGKSYEDVKGDPFFLDWLRDSTENSPPGGESTTTFTLRIMEALDGIFREMMDQRLNSVAVVTHGGVIMTLLAAVGIPKMPLTQWAVDNGSGYTISMTPQQWMRDYTAEVFANIPAAPTEEEDDESFYFD